MENFNINLQYRVLSEGYKQFTMALDKDLNINLTESLLKTAKHTMASFKEAQEEIPESFRRTASSRGMVQGHLIDF